MNKNEREELIFDIAQDRLSRAPQSLIWAFATDKISQTLMGLTDDELLEMKPKEKKNRTKSKGF